MVYIKSTTNYSFICLKHELRSFPVYYEKVEDNLGISFSGNQLFNGFTIQLLYFMYPTQPSFVSNQNC